jgi:hypothetical protein
MADDFKITRVSLISWCCLAFYEEESSNFLGDVPTLVSSGIAVKSQVQLEYLVYSLRGNTSRLQNNDALDWPFTWELVQP